MPEVRISIGGRSFEVLCDAGQEAALQAAAGVLDAEARVLVDVIGRMTEPKMLLMSALMLADKTLAAQQKVRALETRLAGAETARLAAETALAEARAAASVLPAPVLPEGLAEALAAIAAEAEALAARTEAAVAERRDPAAGHGTVLDDTVGDDTAGGGAGGDAVGEMTSDADVPAIPSAAEGDAPQDTDPSAL